MDCTGYVVDCTGYVVDCTGYVVWIAQAMCWVGGIGKKANLKSFGLHFRFGKIFKSNRNLSKLSKSMNTEKKSSVLFYTSHRGVLPWISLDS